MLEKFKEVSDKIRELKNLGGHTEVFRANQCVILVRVRKYFTYAPDNIVYGITIKFHVNSVRNEFYTDTYFTISSSSLDTLPTTLLGIFNNYTAYRRKYAVELSAARKTFSVINFRFTNDRGFLVVERPTVSFPLIVRKEVTIFYYREHPAHFEAAVLDSYNTIYEVDVLSKSLDKSLKVGLDNGFSVTLIKNDFGVYLRAKNDYTIFKKYADFFAAILSHYKVITIECPYDLLDKYTILHKKFSDCEIEYDIETVSVTSEGVRITAKDGKTEGKSLFTKQAGKLLKQIYDYAKDRKTD